LSGRFTLSIIVFSLVNLVISLVFILVLGFRVISIIGLKIRFIGRFRVKSVIRFEFRIINSVVTTATVTTAAKAIRSTISRRRTGIRVRRTITSRFVSYGTIRRVSRARVSSWGRISARRTVRWAAVRRTRSASYA
jgi:hypothetical protein